uniref:Putative fasciclin n=1 Tax=Corethrella appendiculata TaxID=1370023 RepID=U5EZ19_9DIPT
MKNFPVISILIIVTIFTSSNCFDFGSLTNFDDTFENWRKSFLSNDGLANSYFNPNNNGYLWPSQSPSYRNEDQQYAQQEEFPQYADDTIENGAPLSDVIPLRDRRPINPDVEFIAGDMGGPPTDIHPSQHPSHHKHPHPHHQPPPPAPPLQPQLPPGFDDTSSLFQHHFGNFFNTQPFSFFNAGPGFNFFDGPQIQPWFKGPHVCTEREESEEEQSEKENNHEIQVQDGTFTSFGGSYHLNFESCVEKHNKHVCTSITNNRGRKRTVKTTKQCCHGYQRSRNSPINAPCEKIDLYPVIETAEKLGAKEFMKSVKKNGLEDVFNETLTTFVPTDVAFTDFAEQMFESNLVVLPTLRRKRMVEAIGMTTKDLVLAHAVNGLYHIEDVDNEQLLPSKFENTSIRINVFPRAPNDQNFNYPYRYTANCVPIVKLNRIAENGIVHVVSRVMMPAVKSIMDIIRERDDMTVLRTVLEKTKLDKMLEENGSDKHFTIFAPTDNAFQKLSPELRRKLKAGKGCATNILKNHILDITFCSMAAINGVKTSTYNLLSEKLEFEYENKKKPINAPVTDAEQLTEADDLAKMDSILINGESRILETDLIATNGAVHVVDAILPTDSSMPATASMDKYNLTLFKRLLDAGDFEEEFDGYENVSYFVPTDKAFEQSSAGKKWMTEVAENPDGLKGNKDLKKFLEYHIAKPLIKTCDLQEKMIETISGDDLRVNLYTTHPVFVNIMNRATVNCARLIHFDDESCGSIIHQVDKVLEPPQMTIYEMLKSNPNYSMFNKFVEEANLTSLLNDTDENLTIFIPKDDVFREVNEWYDEISKNKEELDAVIRSHIVPDVICCSGITHAEWPFVRTAESLNNQRLKLNRNRRPQVQNAGVTKCDIVAKNGVIHEINDVISFQPPKRQLPEADFHRTLFQRPPPNHPFFHW